MLHFGRKLVIGLNNRSSYFCVQPKTLNLKFEVSLVLYVLTQMGPRGRAGLARMQVDIQNYAHLFRRQYTRLLRQLRI